MNKKFCILVPPLDKIDPLEETLGNADALAIQLNLGSGLPTSPSLLEGLKPVAVYKGLLAAFLLTTDMARRRVILDAIGEESEIDNKPGPLSPKSAPARLRPVAP